MSENNPWVSAGRRVAATHRADTTPEAGSEIEPEAGREANAQDSEREQTQERPSGTSESVVAAPPPLTGAAEPQASVVPLGPGEGLPVRMVRPTARLWLVGAHGGAGESTLATLDESWSDTGHAWPTPSELTSHCSSVLVARTNAAGLGAAQTALRQWASGVLGPHTQLLGLVLLADAPGRLPKPLRALVDLVSGGAPRTWQIGWNEDWRTLDPHRAISHAGADGSPADGAPQLNKQLGRLVADLSTLLDQPGTAQDHRS